MTVPSVPPDNSISAFSHSDIASQPLVEAMLTEMMGSPDSGGDNTVRNAARDYALKEIKESADFFCDPLTIGDLEGQTWLFIIGYRQALEDVSKRGG